MGAQGSASSEEPVAISVSATATLRPSRGDPAPHPHRPYLMVFEAGAAWRYDLPESGAVTLGRGAEVDLVIEDAAASRVHARLVLQPNGAFIEDAGSHNGTYVNGERIGGARRLGSGETLRIGTTDVVFHCEVQAPQQRHFLSAEAFVDRLKEELDRALRYVRTLAVVVARLDPTGPAADRARTADALGGLLRPFDAAAFLSGTELALLLPELAADQLEAHLEMLTTRLRQRFPKVEVGLACCPHQGTDADTLLVAARHACSPVSAAAAPRAPRGSVELDVGDQRVIVCDPAMVRLYALVRNLARSDLPVLIHGPTGTGKELVAQALHAWSPRSGGRLVTVNCAAIPESLLESELFGHERGAFSGATATKVGLFEAADGGTLFLDEVGELSAAAQAKLLRLIETQRFTRVGDVRERKADVRIVSATHRTLVDEVTAGRFREDLLFRLRGGRLVVPPLRDRRSELPVMAQVLLQRSCESLRRAPMVLSGAAMQALCAYDWPGNVRELKSVMGLLAATVPDTVVETWHLPEEVLGVESVAASLKEDVQEVSPSSSAVASFRPIEDELRELERSRMVSALQASGWVQKRAAALLTMPLRTFVTRMKQYEIPSRAESGQSKAS